MPEPDADNSGDDDIHKQLVQLFGGSARVFIHFLHDQVAEQKGACPHNAVPAHRALYMLKGGGGEHEKNKLSGHERSDYQQ